MDPLIIPYSYQARHLILVYIILLIGGFSMAFVIINDSAQHGIPGGLLWQSIISLCFIVAGLWGLRNYVTRRPFSFVIDDIGIHSNHTLKFLVKSVRWDELSSVSLKKRYVKIQYKSTEDGDKIYFPVYHQHNEIKAKLSESAQKHGLTFSADQA